MTISLLLPILYIISATEHFFSESHCFPSLYYFVFPLITSTSPWLSLLELQFTEKPFLGGVHF